MNIRKLKKIKSPAYRHAYVDAHVDQGLAHQIRSLREARGWDQKYLAGRLGIKSQSAIARMEDPSYGKLSIATIKKLAKAFDVAVLVKYVPFSRFMVEISDLSAETLNVTSFEDELPELERSVASLSTYRIFVPGNSLEASQIKSTPTLYISSAASAAYHTSITTTEDQGVSYA